MPEYQLELKQLVDYPRCRIYRKFIQSLIADRSFHSHGGSGLFYYIVLCSLANFRSSYQRIERTSYLVHPGEWICTLSDLTARLRLKQPRQALQVLERLQKQHYITFSLLARGRVVKFKITDWQKSNTVLDYNAPCQKDAGFFFFPIAVLNELISLGKCSELDILLDLWLHTVYRDERVRGSDKGPVVYYRSCTGEPFVSYTELAERWGVSRSTVSRTLNKLAKNGHLTLIAGTGKKGSVIYLNNYLSTMFQISDVLIDKEEIAMSLCFHIQVPKEPDGQNQLVQEEQISVSGVIPSVSKSHIPVILSKVAGVLYSQGIPCCRCRNSRYKLYSYPDACRKKNRLELTHYYVDMVFYNKLLRAYVLIELKTTKLTPEAVGQLNMYLNYYAAEVNDELDNPPIGIILCTDKDSVAAEYALGGLSNNIFASRYVSYIPDKEQLIAQVEAVLKEWHENEK